MDNKLCPDVPVILYTGGWWLQQYQNQFANMLAVNKNKLYLHLGEWRLTSTNTFSTLDEIFAFVPTAVPDSFKFSYYVDGYFERTLMHEFTGQKQKCTQIQNADGTPATVLLSLWNDTPEKLKEFFKIGTVPPVPPPSTDIVKRIEALEAGQLALINRVDIVEKSNLNLVTIFNKALAKLKEFLEEI